MRPRWRFIENQKTIDLKDQWEIMDEDNNSHEEKLGMSIFTSLLIEKMNRFWKDKEDDFEGIDDPWDHYISTPLWKLCEWVDRNAIEDWLMDNEVWITLWENYVDSRKGECETSFLEENPDGELGSEEYYEYEDGYFDEVNSVWHSTWIDEFFREVVEELGLTFERVWRDSIRKTSSFYKEDMNEDYGWRECITTTWDDYLIETNLVEMRERKLMELGL